jgi:hypothetical protein
MEAAGIRVSPSPAALGSTLLEVLKASYDLYATHQQDISA